MPGPETFFKLYEVIFGVLFCIGLAVWGVRILTKEVCDWYEDLQVRRQRWRQSQPPKP